MYAAEPRTALALVAQRGIVDRCQTKEAAKPPDWTEGHYLWLSYETGKMESNILKK